MSSVRVKRYRNKSTFQRDARMMAKYGWRVQSTDWVTKRRGCIGALFYWLCFGWLFAALFQTKNGKFVVTYVRP